MAVTGGLATVGLAGCSDNGDGGVTGENDTAENGTDECGRGQGRLRQRRGHRSHDKEEGGISTIGSVTVADDADVDVAAGVTSEGNITIGSDTDVDIDGEVEETG